MYEWEGRVADELELTRADVAAIKVKYPDRLYLQAREALYTWKQKLGHKATYWNLRIAFFRAGHYDYSSTVRSILDSTPAAHDTCDISVKVAAFLQEGETTDVDVEDDKEDKKGWYSKLRSGVRKLYGAAKGLTEGFVKKALKSLNLDIFIRRKYKIRHDKYTDHHQERWWFELTGDESALKELESKWSQVSAEHKKWKLETCPATPQTH